MKFLYNKTYNDDGSVDTNITISSGLILAILVVTIITAYMIIY